MTMVLKVFSAVLLASLVCPTFVLAADPAPILIGLNADMSTADAESGEAIKAGALIAIAEINASGGVLGRPLALEVRDHRRNPARGVVNVRDLADQEDVVAILGGKHTPVVLAELETIHEMGIPYLVPWAAGTAIIDNGYTPNFVFRVSIRDEFAGGVMVEHAVSQGHERLGLVLERTGWGRSNEKSLLLAARERGLPVPHVEWFTWGEEGFCRFVDRLVAAGCQALIFVGNAPDGVSLMRSLLSQPLSRRLPVISHWGIVGGEFLEPLGAHLADLDLVFLQSYSFLDPPFPDRAERVFQGYQALFPEARDMTAISAPTGVAHAYDLVHLLARAVEQAGTTERARVRDALENLDAHTGLIRDYAPPFTADRHDALDQRDYHMARFVDGVIIPLGSPVNLERIP
jgi:branched-chain amino acid transport system substrate-binding protein